MTPIIEVAIPTDGSVTPCEFCGSITVDLDGNPRPCSYAECPGKCQAPHPLPPYRCIEFGRDHEEVDVTAKRFICFKPKGHDGEHAGNGERW